MPDLLGQTRVGLRGSTAACMSANGATKHEAPPAEVHDEERRLFLGGFPPPGANDAKIRAAFSAHAGPVEAVAAEEVPSALCPLPRRAPGADAGAGCGRAEWRFAPWDSSRTATSGS